MSWHLALAFPCFWAAAALNVFVCLRFFHRFHAHAPSGAPMPTALAAGQKKDAWLLAATVWTAIALRGSNALDVYLLATLPLLVWLLQRAVERSRCLQRR
ncbi:MAG: hypothetical protein JWQ73_2280 [Variovorax sp.]|nr:hypothetical protein [Variovorax sp.]